MLINVSLNKNKKDCYRDGSNKSADIIPNIFHSIPPLVFIIYIIIQNNTNCNKKRQNISFAF